MGDRLRVFGMFQVSHQVVVIVIPAGTREPLVHRVSMVSERVFKPSRQYKYVNFALIQVQKQRETRETTLSIMHGKLRLQSQDPYPAPWILVRICGRRPRPLGVRRSRPELPHGPGSAGRYGRAAAGAVYVAVTARPISRHVHPRRMQVT
jgi:hypothetical protein